MSAIKSLINEILIKSFDISKSKSKRKKKQAVSFSQQTRF